MPILRIGVSLLAYCACAPLLVKAQTNVAYGELYGVVSDATGASMAGVSVTLESAGTDLTR